MRTRTRTGNIEWEKPDFALYYENMADPSQPPIGLEPNLIQAGSRVSEDSVISDTIGSTDGRSRFRPCFHVRAIDNFTGQPVVIPPVRASSGPRYTISPETVQSFIDGAEPDLELLTRSEMDAFAARAVDRMMPSLNNGFSLYNFLYELKDMRAVASSLLKRKNVARAVILGTDPNDPRSWREIAGRKPGKTVAQGHLNAEFGWKPFVADIKRIWQNLTTLNKRLDELVRRAGRPQTRHYSEEYSPASEGNWVEGVKWFEYGAYRIVPVTRTRRLIPHRVCATMRFTYQLPDIRRAQLKARAMKDNLGLNFDPSTAWNAIPFTFLVDWLVDVGGFLRRFSWDTLGLQTVIEDFCKSQKSSVITEYALEHHEALTSGPLAGTWLKGQKAYVGSKLRILYDRDLSRPGLFSALSTSDLNVREGSLLGSLIVANRRR